VIFWSGQLEPRVRALVGLDAVAPLAGGDLSVSADFAGPSLHLLSEQHNCMGGSRAGFDAAAAPKMLATVSGSSHCDALDSPLAVCERGCGGTPWSADRSLVFRRYATAWVVCLLGHQGALMQPYLDGVMLHGDVEEGRLGGVEHEGLDGVICQP
jgi:hypothetical protein